VKRRAASFFSNTDFRQVLIDAYEERSARRKSYSIRAFARDLGIRHSTLSAIMRGLHGMSGNLAREISAKLNLSKRETEYFVALVDSKHARSKLVRDEAKQKLLKLTSARAPEKIIDSAHFLSTWVYPATLELVSLGSSRVDADFISKRLKISKPKAEEALMLLLSLGLIKKMDSGFARVKEHLVATGNTPKPILRQFHKQILDLGKKAIDEQPIEQRRVLSATFSFDSRKTEKARAWLYDVYQNFLNEFATGGTSDSVNAVSMQFFRVDHKEV
jgi:uncharacterized protein (TIGR02147 family)